ncbi:MAG: hypothetical protein ACTSWE_08000, partial [Promethearchaeota archaeon]
MQWKSCCKSEILYQFVKAWKLGYHLRSIHFPQLLYLEKDKGISLLKNLHQDFPVLSINNL